MIRAVIEGGRLRPLDPLPLQWREGQEVGLEISAPAEIETDDLDVWVRELDCLGPALYEPGERERVRAILDEADALAKEQVRRAMGLL